MDFAWKANTRDMFIFLRTVACSSPGITFVPHAQYLGDMDQKSCKTQSRKMHWYDADSAAKTTTALINYDKLHYTNYTTLRLLRLITLHYTTPITLQLRQLPLPQLQLQLNHIKLHCTKHIAAQSMCKLGVEPGPPPFYNSKLVCRGGIPSIK